MKNPYSLILATDLDGTFLEGPDKLKYEFYSELVRKKNQILLVYVTGRGVGSVAELCFEGHLPLADYVIGDHGTHIVHGSSFEPINSLQDQIAARWNNANEKIKTMLFNDPGIVLQPLNPLYRVAYYYDPKLLQPETTQKIKKAGFECILSCDMYLDILPKGVNKGTTLMNFIDYMGLNSDSVLVCGDSLNDLSLFQTGTRGIVVGNAEEKLIQEIEHLENVYHSPFPGVAGILNGLKFYNKDSLFDISLLGSAPIC